MPRALFICHEALYEYKSKYSRDPNAPYFLPLAFSPFSPFRHDDDGGGGVQSVKQLYSREMENARKHQSQEKRFREVLETGEICLRNDVEYALGWRERASE